LIGGWGEDSGQGQKTLYGSPGAFKPALGKWASNHTRQPTKNPVKWGILAEKSRIQTFQLESCSWAAIVAVLIPYELDTSAFKKLQDIFEPSRCILCIWCSVH
jgi:hypothetical protein